ncbi:sugar-binding transcriptional regulator [Salinibacterium soli]|uniref:Sugar-binding domain-containing protein n=1 Tax=Antiquaquibacter soli TaxID=3064523 RepID=A0ABT9BI01_9MICO|nr:sugar-binding domain-containing protein [Protaetiibacter sp. WY-16]MDO7880655.1 sugar-binding domain-containing protein [Protaetiibacter sp. WY-16]
MAPLDPAPRTPAWESAIVARRYYLEGKQKNEIADELGISRFKVARLLDDALAQGVVRIDVALPDGLDVELGDALAARFGIRRGHVALAQEGVPTTDLLGSAAARLLTARLTRDDVLGISWGSTLTAVVDAVDELAVGEVVQLVGGVASAGLEVNGVELLRRIARSGGATVRPLHAPFLVGSADTARLLRDDPSLAPTIERFSAVTVALLGIGSLSTGRSALWTELDAPARAELTRLGAVADLGGSILAADGSIVTADALDRVIAIDAERLAAVGEVIAVAGGEGKSDAIAAALRSGLVDTLVTDSATARELLADPA